MFPGNWLRSKMKSILKYFLAMWVQNDKLWGFSSRSLARLSWFLDFQRKVYEGTEENALIGEAIDICIPNMTVKSGPFVGMRYSEKTSISSALFPKLLGSYERELHAVIEAVCMNNYEVIIDVGCAEGYYAVGLALRAKDARIFAFDLNQKALELCAKTAEINGVLDRIVISSECTSHQLAKLTKGKRALIICDCDGCELGLFTNEIIPSLLDSDLIIETHDCYDMSITGILRSRFKNTHSIQVIDSIPDIKKVFEYKYEEIERFDLNTRRLLLSERPHHQEWFYITPVYNKGKSESVSYAKA